MVTLAEPQRSCVEMGKLPEGQPFLWQSGQLEASPQ